MAEDYRRFDFANVISRTAGVIARRGWLFVGLAALIVAPPQLAMRMFSGAASAGLVRAGPPDFTAIFVSGLLSFVAAMVLQIALVHAVVADGEGRRPSFLECIGIGIRLFIPALLLSILQAFACTFAALLLIVPGVMLYMMWILALPALVCERIGIFASFGRSRELTKGHRWAIFGLVVLLLVVLGATQAAALQVALLVKDAGAAITLIWLFSAALSALVSMLWATLLAALYVELREAKEGGNPQVLGEVFA